MISLLYVIFTILEFLVGFRFLFRLLGANPANILVAWVYDLSGPLVAPFQGIFGGSAATPGTVVQGTFEWASLVALVVYGLIAAALVGLFTRRHASHL